MVVLGGKVYVLGGFDGLQRINNVETYDPFHNCWSEVWEMVSISNFNKSTACGGGRLFAYFVPSGALTFSLPSSHGINVTNLDPVITPV